MEMAMPGFLFLARPIAGSGPELRDDWHRVVKIL
jgi:hypothetical protein